MDQERLINAFDSRVRAMIADIAEVGYSEAHAKWSQGHACGCLGPQRGEPFCPCLMSCKTVMIVEALRKQVIADKIEEKIEELRAAV